MYGSTGKFNRFICTSFFRLTIDRDVDELKAMKEEILSSDLLDVKLGGVSFNGWSWGN